MTSKYWQVIRDDSTRTFEVCGQDSSANHFTNNIHGMQKAGMTVTGMTPPVGGSIPIKTPLRLSVIHGKTDCMQGSKTIQRVVLEPVRRE